MTTPPSHDALTDLALLTGWRSGDPTMGSTLYRRYAEPITAFFRRNLYDRNDIEDLTHETFIALRESATEIESVSAFLFRIAWHKFCHRLRKQKRRNATESSDGFDERRDSADDFFPDPEHYAQQRREDRLLLRAIRRLAFIYQQVLELHFWADKSGPEIRDILQIPEGTVRGRLRLAKQYLEEKLEELAETDEDLRTTTTSLAQWRERVQAELARGPEIPEAEPPPRKPRRTA